LSVFSTRTKNSTFQGQGHYPDGATDTLAAKLVKKPLYPCLMQLQQGPSKASTPTQPMQPMAELTLVVFFFNAV
jgi:hypothetical protein